MPEPIAWSDRVLIVAPSGAGKSTIAAYLMANGRGARQVMVDPKGEWNLGVAPAHNAAELARAIKRDPVVHYVPDDAGDREAMTEAYAALWALPGPLMHVEDEAAETTSLGWAPPGLRQLARRGRSPRKLLICCTQRLAECNPIVRTQATHVIIPVPAPVELDLKPLAAHIGVELDELRSQLERLHAKGGPHSHLWWTASTREVAWMAPVTPPSWPRRRRL